MTTKQTHAATTALQKLRNDWDVMYEMFHADPTLDYTCDTPEYNDYRQRLPSFNFSSLRIPPNTNMLFYGNSYLHEVLQNILVANGDTLIKDGPLGGFEGILLDDPFEGERLTGYLAQWSFEQNSTILEIQNYQPLQLAENAGALRRYLETRQFDVAFFMNPAPRCLFITDASAGGLCECVVSGFEGQFNSDLGPQCDRLFEGQYRGERSDVTPLWDVIYEAMQGKVYEVEAWTEEQRTWFHADDEHTIGTYAILSGHGCNTADNCTGQFFGTEVVGHQCQPGLLTSISELVVAKATKEIQLRPATNRTVHPPELRGFYLTMEGALDRQLALNRRLTAEQLFNVKPYVAIDDLADDHFTRVAKAHLGILDACTRLDATAPCLVMEDDATWAIGQLRDTVAAVYNEQGHDWDLAMLGMHNFGLFNDRELLTYLQPSNIHQYSMRISGTLNGCQGYIVNGNDSLLKVSSLMRYRLSRKDPGAYERLENESKKRRHDEMMSGHPMYACTELVKSDEAAKFNLTMVSVRYAFVQQEDPAKAVYARWSVDLSGHAFEPSQLLTDSYLGKA